METTRNLVRSLVKFTTSMQPSKNKFQGTNAFFRVNIYWNTTTIVFYTNNIIFFQYNVDGITETCHGLINTVVHNFIHQVM